jgi:hypothetical protein
MEMHLGPRSNGHARPTMLQVPQRRTAQDWAWAQIPDPDFLLGEVFSTTSRTLLSAPTGVGKTMICTAIGLAMSEGRDLLHWRAGRDGAAKILFVDGEMSPRQAKRRFMDALRRAGFDPNSAGLPENFHFICLNELPERPPPLNTPEGQEYFDRVIAYENYDFTIFDNIQALLIGSMAEAEAWADILPWTHSLMKRNIGQLRVDHTGHDKSRHYGTSTKSWQMDAEILLEEIERPWADIALRLKFLKARERAPENRADFEPVVVTLERGQWFVERVDPTQAQAAAPPPKAKSPTAEAVKFYEALNDACIDGKRSPQSANHPAVTQADWDLHLIRRGLIDMEKPHSARTLKSRNRLALLSANWIAINGDRIWCIRRT